MRQRSEIPKSKENLADIFNFYREHVNFFTAPLLYPDELQAWLKSHANYREVYIAFNNAIDKYDFKKSKQIPIDNKERVIFRYQKAVFDFYLHAINVKLLSNPLLIFFQDFPLVENFIQTHLNELTEICRAWEKHLSKLQKKYKRHNLKYLKYTLNQLKKSKQLAHADNATILEKNIEVLEEKLHGIDITANPDDYKQRVRSLINTIRSNFEYLAKFIADRYEELQRNSPPREKKDYLIALASIEVLKCKMSSINLNMDSKQFQNTITAKYYPSILEKLIRQQCEELKKKLCSTLHKKGRQLKIPASEIIHIQTEIDAINSKDKNYIYNLEKYLQVITTSNKDSKHIKQQLQQDIGRFIDEQYHEIVVNSARAGMPLDYTDSQRKLIYYLNKEINKSAPEQKAVLEDLAVFVRNMDLHIPHYREKIQQKLRQYLETTQKRSVLGKLFTSQRQLNKNMTAVLTEINEMNKSNI